MKATKKRYLGFSLVELIIVITILAILGIIAFLSFQSHTGKARDANRISSIGIIKKGLELQFLKTGTYPIPDNVAGVGILNGEIVNMVGTIGANISQMINLDKPPMDPSSDIEYMYGISENKKKYQIGATLESLQSNVMFPISYAGMYTAKVEGNYKYPLNLGGKLASLPSLLFVGPSDLLSNSTGFIINGGTNLPYSPSPDYVNTQTTSEVLEEVTGVPGLEVKTVDFTEFTSSNELKTTDGGEVDSKLQELGITKEQAGDALFGEKYGDVSNISVDWSKQEETTAYSCIGDLVLASAIVSNDVMLGANANYQTADPSASCYYTCKENYTGINCQTFTPPPSTCATPQPNCHFAGGCDLVDGTPTTQNQVWAKGATSCGFVCKTNFVGNYCETYAPPSCGSKPACYLAGGCDVVEGAPITSNQDWNKGASNCGFTCKTNFIGNYCETYAPPSCGSKPACYLGGGCEVIEGTPSSTNQAWIKGASNCGFTCKINYSGNYCETFTPPVNTCATNPTCYTNGGCILTIGTPSSLNQIWVKGASNCGFTCKTNYSGNNCETYTAPSCGSNPACSPSGCTLTTGTPTTQNQSWVKGASNCGFTCKINYSGNYCETYIAPSCGSNPACSPSGCTLTTGTPTTQNQSWVKGASNCGFTCKTNYSGNNCETYIAPSCGSNPACSPSGCTLTTGTPTQVNQAWTKGSSNCGFVCNAGYVGTYCETYAPPSCGGSPACASGGGCTLTTGTPTTTNQSWVKGAPNCGFVCKSGYSGTYCETYTPTEQSWKDISGTNSDNDDIVFVDNGTTYRLAGSNSVLGTTGISTNGGAYNGKCYSYSASYGGTACFGDTTKENAYNASGQNNIWGKLYTWTEANKPNNACPTGWRLPTQDEFMKLEKYLTCSNYTTKDTWRCAGLGWQGSSSKTTSNNLVKALKLPLSGYRTTAGFLDRGASAYLWTSTPYTSTTAHGRYLNYANNGVSHGGYSMTQFGLSVRCIKSTITGPVNAIAGEDNGKTLANTPTNLCSDGTASAVSGSGPWTWTCSGVNGGASINGSASKIASVGCTDGMDDIVIGTLTWSCKNLGATTVRDGGTICPKDLDCKSQYSWAGYYYQWGSTSNTWVQGNTDWVSPANPNLWGGKAIGISGKYSDASDSDKALMKGPCPNGRHVPTYKEINTACTEYLGKNCTSTEKVYLFRDILKFPPIGTRSPLDGRYDNNNSSLFWSSTNQTNSASYRFSYSTSGFIYSGGSRGYGGSVRCVKN